jgi:hypothetical protein
MKSILKFIKILVGITAYIQFVSCQTHQGAECAVNTPIEVEFQDAKQYDLDLKNFQFVLDSLKISRDTLLSASVSKLNYLKKRYSNVNHVEILKKLEELNVTAFQFVSFKFPIGYKECYKDESIPAPQRLLCIKTLIRQYVRTYNFNKVIQLDREFRKYFSKPDRENEYFSSQIDSVKNYLSKINSLVNSKLSDDSLYYFKALALESICKTWYCNEGCGGCDLSPVSDKLKLLPIKFPKSQLIDNAMLYLLNVEYLYDHGEDRSMRAQNQEYESFLKKYPDSDLKADVLYSIFINLVSMQEKNKQNIKSISQRFLNEFKSDSRVAEIKQHLKDLKILY